MKKKSPASRKPTQRELLERLRDGNLSQPMGSVHSSLSAIAERRKAAGKQVFSPTAEDAAAFGYDPKWRQRSRRKADRKRLRLQRGHATRLMQAFSRGYNQKDKARGEDYLTVLNHLAEGTYDPRLMTKFTLAECLGWMQREHGHMVDHLNEINGGLLKIATESLVSQMEKGLFKKGRSKCG